MLGFLLSLDAHVIKQAPYKHSTDTKHGESITETDKQVSGPWYPCTGDTLRHVQRCYRKLRSMNIGSGVEHDLDNACKEIEKAKKCARLAKGLYDCTSFEE